MAMTFVQQIIALEFQNLSTELIGIQARLTALNSMYTNENMGALQDADFAAYPDMAHISAADFQAAGGALVAINTTLNNGTPSNWSKLLRIVKSVPH